jgi:L-lactate dehydrogenase complex protein LldG
MSRAGVLGKIRAANGGATTLAAAQAAWEEIPREYRRTAGIEREEILEMLEDRLRDYDAHVVRSTRADVPDTVAAMLRTRNRTRMLMPEGVDASLLPSWVGFAVDDSSEPLMAAAIDKFEGVLTESTLAIAETGTIVLQTAPGQGRRALSLIPDYHLCLVRPGSVVRSVPEAMDVLGWTPAFATTFISGPSATADIEMTRIKGVHGPRFLDVILVMD